MRKLLITKDVYNILLEKGFGKKDYGKLQKKQITDKNGHTRTVYVKAGEEPKKQRVKKQEEVKSPKAKTVKMDEQKINKIIESSKEKLDKVQNGPEENALFVSGKGMMNKKEAVSYLNQKINYYENMSKQQTKETEKDDGKDNIALEEENNRLINELTELKEKNAKQNGIIPPDKFNAQNYKKSQTDPKVTPDEAGGKYIYDLLKADPDYTPELIDRIIDETQKRLSKQEKKIKKIGDTENVYSDGKGNYTKERQKLHEEIINKFLSPEKIKNCKAAPGEKPKYIMLGGRGGSGKSFFTDKDKYGENVMFDPDKFIILDADAIKDYLKPPYEGWNAGEAHEESSYLNKLINKRARELNLNIIVDGTMNYNPNKPNKVRDEMLSAKAQGYRIEAHYMFLPIQESCKRAVMRFANSKKGYDCSGRLVPMNILTSMQDNEMSFDSVKDIVDDWSFRDNNVKRGELPKLVSKKAN